MLYSISGIGLVTMGLVFYESTHRKNSKEKKADKK
ncbi:hypothetical protein ABE871_18210 [Enterococcus gilvus]